MGVLHQKLGSWQLLALKPLPCGTKKEKILTMRMRIDCKEKLMDEMLHMCEKSRT